MKNIHDRSHHDEVVRLVQHYTIEDHEDQKGIQYGVMLEFFDAGHGPAMIVTPFSRGLQPLCTIELRKSEGFNAYPPVSSDVYLHVSALVSGIVDQETAIATVLKVIHALIPAEWAGKHLPELYQRYREMGLKWDGSKLFCCPNCKSQNLKREYSSGYDGYRCNDCQDWNYAKVCCPEKS